MRRIGHTQMHQDSERGFRPSPAHGQEASWSRRSTQALTFVLTAVLLSTLVGAAFPGRGAAVRAAGAPARSEKAVLAGVVTGRSRSALAPRRLPAPPLCVGAHDLLVDGSTIAPAPSRVYGRICVINGGKLTTWSGALRAGVLYIDGSSMIDTSGLPGSDQETDCNNPGNGQRDGSPGDPITLTVRQAIIMGSIDASGGAGESALPIGMCSGSDGDGGSGGAITLHAASLTLAGTIKSDGGPAGDDAVRSGTYDLSSDAPRNGGAGGVIHVVVAHHSLVDRSLLHVDGGAGNTVCLSAHDDISSSQCGAKIYARGKAGAAGHVVLETLTPAAASALPPLPVPLVSYLGVHPVALPLVPATVFARGMTCGKGDVNIGAGMTRRLGGDQSYAHVCIHDGGTLLAGPSLRLRAKTILVDARSYLSASAVVKKTASGKTAGCTLNHRAPAAGAAGPLSNNPSGDGPHLAGGPGGGTLTLVANRILLAGQVSANGGVGRKGANGGCSPSGCLDYFNGSDGGNGGGILIVARTAQVTDVLSASGGPGGAGGTAGSYSANNGAAGASGCIKIFVSALSTPPGGLSVTASTVLGQPSSADLLPLTRPLSSAADARRLSAE